MLHRARHSRRRWFIVAAVTLAGLALAPVANASARFRVVQPRPFGSVCDYSHTAADDPIVKPGEFGASHSHDFFGARTTNAETTLDSLIAAPTSCRFGTDQSAYWAPTLFADGVAIEPLQVHAYYLRRTVKKVVAPPAGLRIVAGGTRDTVRFTCIVQRMPQRVTQMVPKCDRGMFAIGIAFPECWNGVDLDSADHRSHMAYAADGVCPPSHPVAVPRLRLFVGYPRPPATAALTLASGPMETAHADFFNAWQPEMLDTLVRHCLNAQRPRNCSKHGNRRLAQLDAALARPEATAPLPPSSTDPVPTDPAPPAPPVDGALLDSGTAVSDASRSEPVVSAAAAFVESNHVPGCGLGAEPAPI